jgi:hypothetical protein
MTLARRYRLLALSLLVVGVLLFFLSFFFVFVLAPIIPLALFYLGFLYHRETVQRRSRRAERQLLASEAVSRQVLLDRFEDVPRVGETR